MSPKIVCAITGLFVLALVISGGGVPPPGPLDHFLSYQIKKSKGAPKFEKREVFLSDRFGEGDFEVKKPVALLNPAGKNGEGITDRETHLISYRVKGPDFEELENVPFEDQFGELLLDVKRPDRLLVPASKNLSFPPDPPIIPDINLEHFPCYPVEESDPTQGDDDDDDDDDGGGDLGIQASVEDQFTQPKLFDVIRPTRLCNPVDKEGEGIKNPDNQLLCYQVKPARGEPRHRRIRNIFVHDQFGPKQVDAIKERELCVPSKKEVPPRTVFLSSSTHKGNLGGLAGGDRICQDLADAAGLSGTYLAWLSDSNESPRTRFTQSTVPYVRVDGVKVADSWLDLTDSSLDAPINVDQTGTSRRGRHVWTGTKTAGRAAAFHCSGWTALTGDGETGDRSVTNRRWTEDSTPPCGGGGTFTGAALYCFQQGHSKGAHPTIHTARRLDARPPQGHGCRCQGGSSRTHCGVMTRKRNFCTLATASSFGRCGNTQI